MDKALIIYTMLVYGGVVDYKRREIPDIVPIVILLCGLSLDLKLLSGILCLTATAAVFSLMCKLTKSQIPGGDFKLLCAMSFTVGLIETAISLAIAGILSVAYGIAKKKPLNRSIPLCSYMAVAYVIFNSAILAVYY